MIRLDLRYKKWHKKVIKVVIAGESGVGKTTLFKRLNGETLEYRGKTVGVEIDLLQVFDDHAPVKAIVYDLGGEHRFKPVIPFFLPPQDIIFLMFDLTDSESFKRLEEWVKIIDINPKKVILIGNKVDLLEKVKVPDDVIKKFRKEKKIKYFLKISAKEGTNVNNLLRLIEEIILTHAIPQRAKVVKL